MDERRVHIYASGRGFAVVPVCYLPEKGWMECEPVQEVRLEKGLPMVALFEKALERAAQCPCRDLQVWSGTPGGWRDHHLFAARLIEREETWQLFILPDPAPAMEWPADTPVSDIVRYLIAQLRTALT